MAVAISSRRGEAAAPLLLLLLLPGIGRRRRRRRKTRRRRHHRRRGRRIARQRPFLLFVVVVVVVQVHRATLLLLLLLLVTRFVSAGACDSRRVVRGRPRERRVGQAGSRRRGAVEVFGVALVDDAGGAANAAAVFGLAVVASLVRRHIPLHAARRAERDGSAGALWLLESARECRAR